MKFQGLFASAVVFVNGQNCPMFDIGTPPTKMDEVPTDSKYKEALQTLDITALTQDLTTLMRTNQDCWPHDDDHYGPLFIRAAWHASGTYRNTDHQGGSEGGRQRFPPESDWPDNANLDHARALLAPLKVKYGMALSWGDLLTFAGTLAIRDMGGPTLPFCFGRTDDGDGSKSDILNDPANCTVQGACTEPYGAVTVGLIYVNPAGPLKNETDPSSGPDPDPAKLGVQIREVFSRMGYNDSETVALIAGGHAFGRMHGAADGGNGKGRNTITSGFEGLWTNQPTKWAGVKQYLDGSLDFEWEQVRSPRDNIQWQSKDRQSIHAGTVRLTADLSMVFDPEYKKEMLKFQANLAILEDHFAIAWHRLMTQGTTMANGKKCEGDQPAPSPTPDNQAEQIAGSVLINTILMAFALQNGSV